MLVTLTQYSNCTCSASDTDTLQNCICSAFLATLAETYDDCCVIKLHLYIEVRLLVFVTKLCKYGRICMQTATEYTKRNGGNCPVQ